MVDADPLNGQTPYEVLGVDETETVESIEQKADEAYDHYAELRAEARDENDDEKFDRALDALEEIYDAWNWIENHHEPPVHDGLASIEVLTGDHRVGSPIEVEVTGANGPIETLVEASSDAEGTTSDQTDSNGRASFTFSKHDVIQFTVPTTDEYDDATDVVTVEPKQVDLSFDAVPGTAEVGESVRFSVIGDGSSVSGVELEAGSTRLGTTDSNGALEHAFDAVDEYTVSGTKSDDDEATYSKCETTIDVVPETAVLELSVDGSDHEYGDEITVRVHESDSPHPIEGVTVSVGSSSDTTDAQGVAELELEEGGSLTVKAEKQATEDTSYQPTTESISVDKRERSLRVEDVSGSQMEGSELTVRVVDDTGHRVEDARIKSNWGHNDRTDDDGEASLSLNRHGPLEITAEKETDVEDFGSDIRSIEIEEFTRELQVELSDTLPDPGDTITVTVTDGRGQPVKNATITCNRRIGKEWNTDSSGEVAIQLNNQVGNRQLTIKKENSDFGMERRTVRVL